MSVIEFNGKKPYIHPSVFLAPGSWVIGDVTLDEDVNVWTNAVIRGDDDVIKIGARTTILEGCIIKLILSTANKPSNCFVRLCISSKLI